MAVLEQFIRSGLPTELWEATCGLTGAANKSLAPR